MLLAIRLFIFCLFLLSLSSCDSGPPPSTPSELLDNGSSADLIDKLLKNNPSVFSEILANKEEYDIQIIYTQIDRDENNVPSFKQFDYGLDAKKYFYPASLVKLPCAALALEKLNSLHIKGLDKYSRMQTDSAWLCQKKITFDSTSESGYPSIAHYIKKMLLVSDNDAYSRLYEFLGPQYIHEKLAQKGFPNTRIIHRFDVECIGEQNSYTNPVSFYDSHNALLYAQPLHYNSSRYDPPIGGINKGKGHIDNNGKYVDKPKDFTHYNYLCLQDIHDILKSLIFPYSVEEKKRFDLSADDHAFLYKYMSMYPRESDFPRYTDKEFHDSYKKYFIYGTAKNKIEGDSLRIFNVVGQSYGFLSDCAYVCDIENKIEFLLSAVIYANKDGVMNDGKYDYEEIGLPFLSNIGTVIYNYERKRQKKFIANLSSLKYIYE